MRDDTFDADRPSIAELEAAKAAIVAFRDQHKTLGTAALAIAFIEQRGSATSAELSILLGLGADEYPSVVLRSSVQGERLAVDNRVWTLGPKAVPSTRTSEVTADDVKGLPQKLVSELSKPAQQLAAKSRDALASGAELGRKTEIQIPTFAPSTAPSKAPTAAPLATPTPTSPPAPPATSSRCRFALWSDGQVTIVAPNGTSRLSQDEFDELIRFVARMNSRHRA